MSELKSFDPSLLVELAKVQLPEKKWLPAALAACTKVFLDDDACIYFVNNTRPNQPGSVWQFKTNLILKHPTEGDLVLDILDGNRVGSIEYLARL